ncbi:hypothetical protein FACS1894191_0180 [Clostridia bacterium]|nr:hypothetical protein FACS1894191_0180 [Clostridia bacterium]
MYSIGDLIVYGNTGVCRVSDITTRDVPGTDKNLLYYVLIPVYQDRCTIYAPTDVKVFMRPVISKEEAEKLIDMIPSIKVSTYYSCVVRDIEEHYKKSIISHDISDLVELTISIYTKKLEMARQNRRFGAMDERFMKLAEELLFGELAVALGIAKGDVPDYIAERIGERKENRNECDP